MSVHETATTDESVSLQRSESDEWDLIPIQPGSTELSIESALLWCLNPAIHGIKSIGVLSAQEKAKRLVEACNGDTTAAVVMAAGGEGGGAKRTKIIFEFLLRQVPLVGCPAYILTSTWSHLRAVSIIAAIYGHDLEQPRTQHEILWCLLPNQPESGEGLPAVQGHDTGPIAATAKTVSNVLISTALKKTIGITMVSELFQLGTDLWAVSAQSKSAEDDDGFEHLTLGPSATARHYFCPETQWSRSNFFYTLLGVLIPWLFRIPSIVTSLALISLSVLFVNRRRLPTGKITKIFAPKLVAYAVFSLHAILPVLGISNGTSLFVQSAAGSNRSVAERLSLAVLGAMALSAGLKGANFHAEIMHVIHIEARKVAVVIGVLLHLLPLLDRHGIYTSRIAWALSDTELCSVSRSLHFLSVVISSTTQQMLLQQLKRRDVILRLLGAERVMVLSLTLFFRGITAAVTTESLLPFFKSITPHPVFCCAVMTTRRHPVPAAMLLALVPLIPLYTASPIVSLLAGLVVGTVVVIATWMEWKENENVYMSNMRLLYMLPGVVSGKTKEVVDNMLKAGGKTAIKSVLIGLVRRMSDRLFKK